MAIAGAVGVIVLALACRWLSRVKDHAGRIDCAGNLKQLAWILQQYSDDHDGKFPASPSHLVRGKYAHAGLFECQSCRPWLGRRPVARKGFICDYLYFRPQGVDQSGPDADRTVVLCDKPGNHRRYGNVLYASGRVEGLVGVDWSRQAGIGNQNKINQ